MANTIYLEAQARAILELRLHRLTGLEHEKIVEEYKELLTEIGELIHILTSPERLMEVIREELERVKPILMMNAVLKLPQPLATSTLKT